MKPRVIVIALLFSSGLAAAGGQTTQEKRATPLPQATPSGADAKRNVDQPVRAPASNRAETPSPAQAPSQQQTQTISPSLQESLVGLTDAVKKLVDKQAEQESTPIKFFDFFTALAGTIGALVVLCGTLIALRKRSWFEKNKLIITLTFFAIVFGIVLLVSLYLLSGLVIAMLYGVIAIIILFVALLIAAAHLLTFIDEKYPELKREILKLFPESPGGAMAGEPSSSGYSSGMAMAPPRRGRLTEPRVSRRGRRVARRDRGRR